MKVKRSETAEGKIELEIIAPADKVEEAIRFVDFQLAMQNGINPQGVENLSAAVKEKVGAAYYDSFIDFQAMNFLAPFAVTQEKLDIIGPPKVISEIVKVVPGKELAFKVQVAPKPIYELEDYSPVSIKVPAVSVAEAEIDDQLVMLAENYATAQKDEDRPLKDGDELLFKIKVTDDKGEVIEQLTADSRAYSLGKNYLPKEFDAELIGLEPGQSKTIKIPAQIFTGQAPEEGKEDGVFTFDITILELQKRVIPAITDVWVVENIPDPRISTVPQLREEIRQQGLAMREQESGNQKAFLAATELGKRFKGSIPDEYYEMTRNGIVQGLQQNLQQQGKTMQQFVAEQGGDQSFSMQLMMQTREVLVQGFALDALARHLKLEVTDDDLAETFNIMAPGHGQDAAAEFEFTGRLYQAREAALRNKANKWLVENAVIEYVD
jgi:trigger factor